MNHNRISFIFWIFYYFYGIFYYASGRNGTERNDNFYFSLSHLFPTYFGLIWIHNGIFVFFTIFMEFSITLQVGTKRNDNFYFLSFPAFSNLFWLIMKLYWYFLIFWIFLLFFWNFLLHIGQERNGTIIFIVSISASSILFWLKMRQ